ncbi:MAG: TonB-dependent receptor [Bacteroidales bacterium]|nr:TonB-dependent receptor [Bacteroidales bacterium]
MRKVLNDDSDFYEEPPDTILLETTVIQAVSRPMVSSLSRVVVSFEREDIQRLPVRDIQQLLSHVAGIDLRQRGGKGVQADINIRGGNFDQVMIMLNGINLTDPQTGHHNLNLPIDLSSVYRIEILQGPGARVLGPNASSGAINIITMTADTNLLGARIAVGDHNFSDLHARANLARRNFRVHASAGHSSSTGYTENTDFDITNLFLQIQTGSLERGEFNFQSGYQLKAFGANMFYSVQFPEQFERLRTFINALSYRQNFERINLNANVYHRRVFDRFELFRFDAPAWYAGHNFHQTDVTGLNVRSEISYFPWRTTVGGEFRSEHIFSNVLGEPMSNRRRVPFERDTVFFTRSKHRTIANWFIEQSFFASRFSASIGAMGSFSNDFGHHTCLGVDASYQISNDLSVFASVNQALRLPTFTDLYYSDPTSVGNPYLRPERSNTFEIGSRFNRSGFSANMSVFYREGRNTIDWVRAPGDTVFRSMNHSEVNTFGVETDVIYRFANSRFLQSIRASYAYLNMSMDNLGAETSGMGRRLDYLRHKFVASAHARIWKNLYTSLSWNHRARVGTYVNLAGETRRQQPINLFDARVEWRTKNYQIFIEASNLFDKQYFDFVNLIQAGRWVKTGISLQLSR